MNKVSFIEKAICIDSNLRFQYWYNNYPSKTWYKYEEIIKRFPNLFRVNQQMLRTGIETQEISEFRIDIDSKEEGVKSLNASINVCKFISKILTNNNIKFSTYYSGGSGIHIQFLYNSKPFQKFENQKIIREKIAEYLGFLNLIDRQVLGNNQVLTCEGYSKRNSKDNSLKIYIEKEKGNIDFIKNNKFDTILNENYFNEINDFPKEIIGYVNESIPEDKEKKVSEIKVEKTIQRIRVNNRNIILPSEKIINQHLITFSKIYHEKNINSTNNYYTIVCTYLFSSTMDIDKTLIYFNRFFDIFNCPDNLSCSREQKVSMIVSNFYQGKTKIFFRNEYLNKEEFYGEYYNLFPRNKLNSVAYAGKNNEQNKLEVEI